MFHCVNLRDSAAGLENITSNFPGLQFQAYRTYVVVLIVIYIWPLTYKKGAKESVLA